MAMRSWLLLVALSSAVCSEPLNFGPFFGHGGASFFPDESEDSYAAFSEFSLAPASAGTRLSPNFPVPFTAETSNIPVYSDGSPTPPQVTLSRLERNYKSQLHRLANTRPAQPPRNRPYIPKFRSEPYPSASSIDERRPGKPKAAEDPVRLTLPKTQTVELHTGFVPIIKGSSQDRKSSRNVASTVIKDIEPPILTAAPGVLTAKPTLLKVSASVQSSSKVPPHVQNLTGGVVNDLKSKSRSASFSRDLNLDEEPNGVLFPPSSSERVAGRAASSRPDSISDLQQQDLFRLNGPSLITEESKLAAKKTLEINCDGSHDLGWCELGDNYPRKYVDEVVSSCQDAVSRMHVEVPHSFEKLSDTSDFKAEFDGNSSSQRSAKERSSHDAWSWAAYFHQGSLCEAETGFLRPETAKDSTGKWNIIVQTEHIRQRVPIEMCRKTNQSCKKMLNCGLKSQCLQKYNFHLLLSLNPTEKHDCPFMKLYRFPSACVCHVE